jgi:hypothetical protein
MARPKDKAQPSIDSNYRVGDKVRRRDTGEVGIVDTIAENKGGVWYHISTERGMSLSWWHWVEVAEAPRTVPPTEKTQPV